MSRTCFGSPANGIKAMPWAIPMSRKKPIFLNGRGKYLNIYLPFERSSQHPPDLRFPIKSINYKNVQDVVGDLFKTLSKDDARKIKRQWKQLGDLRKSRTVQNALNFAFRAHLGRKRASGDAEIIHPLSTAAILVNTLKMKDPKTCAALILHDTLEDTKTTKQELIDEFGEEIAALVDAVTHLSITKMVSPEVKDEENLKKLIAEMTKDYRVIAMKFCDRLHNMKTLLALSKERRERNAEETRAIYVKLAALFGMWEIKEELEDLVYKNLFPKVYLKVAVKRNKYIKNALPLVGRLKKRIKDELIINGLQIEDFRVRLHTTLKLRMEMVKRKADNLMGINNIVIILPASEDCFRAIEVIHSIFPPFEEDYRDHITTPRLDFYQSLRTAVKTPHGKLWIALRTREMDELSTRGLIAHLVDYKGKLDEDWLGIIKEARKMLNEEPEIFRYILPDRLDEFRNRKRPN